MSMIPFVLILLTTYLIGRVYSSITGKMPNNMLTLKHFNDSITKIGGLSLIAIPIVAPIIFLYNIIYFTFWFVFIVLSWIVSVLKWIWDEVIIAGGWMILRLFWHYCVDWVWRIFKLGFENIKGSVNLKLYKIAVLSLFVAFLLVFTGRFLVQEFHVNDLLFNVLVVISLLPIGFALITITCILKNNSEISKKNVLAKYFKYAGLLSLLFILFFILEALLIDLGLFGNFKFLISSFMVGGSLLSSILIIFNAVLVLFVFSALPSFALTYEGDLKSFFKSYGLHLFNKWPQYVLAAGAAIIPAIILCILPYYITKGAAFISNNTSDYVYNHKIENLEKQIKDYSWNPDYKRWSNVSAITNDSLTKLEEKDFLVLEKNMELSSLKANKLYINNFYEKYSSPIAAVPVIVIYKGVNMYKQKADKLIATEPVKDVADVDTLTLDHKFAELQKKVSTLKSEIVLKDSGISILNEELLKVCFVDTNAANVEELAVEEPQIVNDSISEPDPCDVQRQLITEQIAKLNNEKKACEKQIARDLKVADHLKQMKEKMISIKKRETLSTIVAYFIISLWYSLLIALSLGFGLVLFARINYDVFNIVDSDDQWMLIKEIEVARAKNSNQPLLGVTIITLIILTFTPLNEMPLKYLKKGIDTVKELITVPNFNFNQDKGTDNNPTISKEVSVKKDSVVKPDYEEAAPPDTLPVEQVDFDTQNFEVDTLMLSVE